MKPNEGGEDKERQKQREKSKKRAPRDINAPKPPLNAYSLYIQQSTKHCKNTNDFREVASAWRTMTDEERKPFVENAATERVKYHKEMEEYKKSDAYLEFIKGKKNHMKKFKGSTYTDGKDKIDGIQIFSKEFLDYNKTRESTLRRLRREIGDLEEETETIEKKISVFAAEFEKIQQSVFNDDFQLSKVEKLLEKWRRSALKAMEDGKLLSHYHLNINSNVQELLLRLEESSKKHDQFSNSLRTCMSNANFA